MPVVESWSPVTIEFSKPVRNAINERTGAALGDSQKFPLNWKQSEACVISFESN